MVSSWVPRSPSSLPSLHLQESSYVCFIHNVQGFQLPLARGTGNSVPTPSCLEPEVLQFIFLFYIFKTHVN